MAAFFDDMEQAVNQQTWFLLQSICVGLVQGVLFDVLGGLGRCGTQKRRLWLDIAFGPLSAFLLFFAGLVILDGQIHPLLLMGSAIGMFFEHITVGIYLSATVVIIYRSYRKLAGVVSGWCYRFGERCANFVRNARCNVKNRSKKAKKSQN